MNDEKWWKKCSNGINLIMIKMEYVFFVFEYKILNKKNLGIFMNNMYSNCLILFKLLLIKCFGVFFDNVFFFIGFCLFLFWFFYLEFGDCRYMVWLIVEVDKFRLKWVVLCDELEVMVFSGILSIFFFFLVVIV